MKDSGVTREGWRTWIKLRACGARDYSFGACSEARHNVGASSLINGLLSNLIDSAFTQIVNGLCFFPPARTWLSSLGNAILDAAGGARSLLLAKLNRSLI